MAEQTAVDVLWENLTSLFFFTDGIPIEAMEIYDKAKEMHEKEIKEAYGHGQNNGYSYKYGRVNIISAETYYEQTFKTQNT
jgi:hypothetical protein